MVKAQEWLEENYPDKETHSIYLNQQLEGVLDCGEYKKLWGIYISSSVDSSKFEIKKGSYKGYDNNKYGTHETRIISCILAQTWLDQNYPKDGTCVRENESLFDNFDKIREEIKNLDIDYKSLEGSLDLSDFTNLERLQCTDNYLTNLNVSGCRKLRSFWCHKNQLTTLDLSNLEQLETLDCSKNYLTQIPYLPNPEKITELSISDNNLSTSDLAGLWKDIHERFAPKYKKDWLEAGYNKEQTKQFLEEWNKDMKLIGPWDRKFLNWFLNLKKLDLEWAKVNEEEFKELRGRYECFGTCEECEQPNTSGGYNSPWCQSCNAKHFQQDFGKWTSGNPQIDKFIQKCQLEATSRWNLLEWIPYEQFDNIKYIANGGFGKVEKARWKYGNVLRWDNKERKWERKGSYYFENRGKYKNYKKIALKTLTNSQNLNQDFLQELTLYKMFRSSVSNMVPCYGVSRDGEGNYIMVMKFMKNGNLRDYLKKNYKELKFYDEESKFLFLLQIIQGLKGIHCKKLIHRDFHSGNIIVSKDKCRITDLGLCKPVDETDNSQVYGVLPYVAPEVLRGQPYTQKSDIYSFGIVAYEILTCLPPYADEAHGTKLTLKICWGERPQFPEQVKYPQLLIDLIKSCWDSEPSKRPAAREISEIMDDWNHELHPFEREGGEFYDQYIETEEHNKTLSNEIRYPTYQSNEVWHSKSINTNQINKLLNDLNLSEKINIQKSKEVFYKESEEIAPIEIKSTGLTKEVEKITLGTKRQNSLSAETQEETKSVRLEELVEEPMDIDYSPNWTNIHSSFSGELTQSWTNLNFTSQQTQDWINIGLQPTDYNFCAWLRNNKHLTPEQVLNKGNLEQLNQEFFTYWQEQQIQTNIEVPPKQN